MDHDCTLPSPCDIFGSCPRSLRRGTLPHCRQFAGVGSSSMGTRRSRVSTIEGKGKGRLSVSRDKLGDANRRRAVDVSDGRAGTHSERLDSVRRRLLLHFGISFRYRHGARGIAKWVTSEVRGLPGRSSVRKVWSMGCSMGRRVDERRCSGRLCSTVGE